MGIETGGNWSNFFMTNVTILKMCRLQELRQVGFATGGIATGGNFDKGELLQVGIATGGNCDWWELRQVGIETGGNWSNFFMTNVTILKMCRLTVMYALNNLTVSITDVESICPLNIACFMRRDTA